MSQSDIIDWLRKQRLTGSQGFFTVNEIKQGTKQDGQFSGVYNQCLQLYRFGILDVKRNGYIIEGYRLKKKYVGMRASG